MLQIAGLLLCTEICHSLDTFKFCNAALLLCTVIPFRRQTWRVCAEPSLIDGCGAGADWLHDCN